MRGGTYALGSLSYYSTVQIQIQAQAVPRDSYDSYIADFAFCFLKIAASQLANDIIIAASYG